MQEKQFVGIFGGSFNPPLNSHLILAEEILKSNLNIDRIIFVPVSTKYNKLNLADNIHRYNMLKLLCKDNPKLEVSKIEIEATRQLYTVETLNILQNKYKNAKLYFILGTDNLKELSTWKCPEEILKKYKIIVLGRNKDIVQKIIEQDDLLKKYKNSFINLNNKRISLSSTFVRNELKKKKDISKYVPSQIKQYIIDNNLY